MCFKKGHVIVRICRFEFLGNSIGILNGETVMSPYRVAVLNPSVIPLEKITRKNLHVSEPPFFFNSEHSIGNHRPNVSVGINRRNDGQKKFRR